VKSLSQQHCPHNLLAYLQPIRRGHEQTIVIASFGIPTNVIVTDTNGKNISFDTSVDDYGVFEVTKDDIGEFYAALISRKLYTRNI
jgi:hypothetical protein